jgi:uncharacterized hydrophobic protein (TIGR00271 family)
MDDNSKGPSEIDEHHQAIVKENNVDQPTSDTVKDEEIQGAEESSNGVQLDSNTVDLDSMEDAVFFLFPDRNQRVSRFFLLIFLASVIATSGVAGDSAATVIGAMIVAPLMTPILGTMLAIVLADRRNFVFSLFLVLSGASMAVLVGFLYGLCVQEDTILAENNSQVAGRVRPKITDLIGALATGAVGSIALVRKDIAGALPGVAIAISLVPPLCVVGLTLSTGNGTDAAGALLLFATNFTSILIVGVIVMYAYKVHRKSSVTGKVYTRAAFLMLLFLLGAVAVPLTFTSRLIRDESTIVTCVTDVVNKWAAPYGWESAVVVANAKPNRYTATVFVTGEPPFPEPDNLTDVLVLPCNVDEVIIRFIPQRVIEL